MAIKEVTDIRVNGKSWKNCNGKELNSLTVNGTTYKLVKNYYSIRFNNLYGDGTGYYDIVQIPEGANVTFNYSLGGTRIVVYVNGSYHDAFNLTPSGYKIFMALDITSINNISSDYAIECKWSNKVGEIVLSQKVYYQEGQEEAGISTIELSIFSSDHLGGVIDSAKLSLTDEDGYLRKVGSTWVADTIPYTEFLKVIFKYYQSTSEDYYSVFIGNTCYNLQGETQRIYNIEALTPDESTITLTIVDKAYI